MAEARSSSVRFSKLEGKKDFEDVREKYPRSSVPGPETVAITFTLLPMVKANCVALPKLTAGENGWCNTPGETYV